MNLPGWGRRASRAQRETGRRAFGKCGKASSGSLASMWLFDSMYFIYLASGI